MAKDKKCDWWKMKTDWSDILLPFPDEAIGKAVKAAYRYLLYEEVMKINDQEPSENQIVLRILFNLFQPSVDDAIQKYREKQEQGRKMQETARQNQLKREEAKRYADAEHTSENKQTNENNHTNENIHMNENEQARDQILKENNIDLNDTERYSIEELRKILERK